tara:strand:- start:1 stop:279 length:279 start_codon:yes stop_codon:yes gene_type:complete
MNTDEILRETINEIIRDEIQGGINEYVDQTERTKESGLGFAEKEGEKELKVNIPKSEIESIMKEYKRIKRNEKSNFGQIKKLSLLDQHGRQL